jgi:hypothetical protein
MNNESIVSLRLECLKLAVSKVASSGLESILATSKAFENYLTKDLPEKQEQKPKNQKSDNAKLLE